LAHLIQGMFASVKYAVVILSICHSNRLVTTWQSIIIINSIISILLSLLIVIIPKLI